MREIELTGSLPSGSREPSWCHRPGTRRVV